MTKLILVRHGHVEGISPERFRGRAELPLTETGHREADATAKRIAASWRPAAIYTSPLGRSVETGAQCGLMAEVPRQFHEPKVAIARCQIKERLPRAVGRAIVHDTDFEARKFLPAD